MTTAARRVIAVLAAGAALSTARPATADDDLVTAEATRRMNEGKELYGAGHYDAAWIKYKQACVVLKTDNCTIGLAFTEFKTKRWLDAYRHIREILVPVAKPAVTPAMLDELTRMMKETYGKTGHVTVRADAGATVTLDDAQVPLSLNGQIDMTPGAHVLVAWNMGKTRRVDVDAPEGMLLNADLTIPVAVEPVATEPVPLPMAPTVVVGPPGERSDPGVQSAGAPAFWSARRTVGVVFGGIGVASLGAGIALQVQRTSDASHAASIRASLPGGACGSGSGASRCDALNSAYSAQTRDADLSSVFLIAGGVVLATGAALFLWPASRSSRVSLVPVITPWSAGLLLQGGL